MVTKPCDDTKQTECHFITETMQRHSSTARWYFDILLIAAVIASTAAKAEMPTDRYRGICDASAAIAISQDMFVVANDEDNRLRVYRNGQPNKPLSTFDLDSFIKPDVLKPEADIEAVAVAKEHAYWITSHGTNKNGKHRASRHRLFATSIKYKHGNPTIVPVGKPYRSLVADLLDAPQLQGLGLDRAARTPPKQVGGLNIEGLSITPNAQLLIGFRNPIPQGKALIVPLKNPVAVIKGQRAVLGDPIRLELDGLGIRSIVYLKSQNEYLIIAGGYDSRAHSRLYRWSGDSRTAAQLMKRVSFFDINPEAILVYPNGRIQVLSDDGTKQIDGTICKESPVEKRSFRAMWLPPFS